MSGEARVVIAGAGLSGLYAAWLLQQRGIDDYLVLEAQDGVGGRIASFAPPAAQAQPAERFDLGPTWFWPGYQPELDRLVADLGLRRFAQHDSGDMLVQRSAGAPPERTRGYASAPPSIRLAGGMASLAEALQRKLDPARIHLGQAVRRIRRTAQGVELDSENAAGQVSTWHAAHVLLALPPRLAEHAIAFSPALPQALREQWRRTPTWMAPHAKYVALYQRPFWRGQGLSGAARSAAGPLGEIHDASNPDGSAALFGFFALPGQARQRIGEDALRLHCRRQLAQLFGPQAGSPLADTIKDWACDPFTATVDDLHGGGAHAGAPASGADAGPWRGCLTGIASEWSVHFPGYVAGAIEAARQGVDTTIIHLREQT